jgi:tetratricopeptide (TPR) repeat protein
MTGKGGILPRNTGTPGILAVLAFVLIVFLPAANAGQDGHDKAVTLLKEADTLLEEGHIDKAIETVKSAVTADPENPEPYDRLGYMLLQKGLPDDAVNAFTAALKIQPTFRTARTGIGLALLKKGDLKAAEDKLTAALSLNPYPSMAHYGLGLVYEKMNDYDKAIAQFKEGIKTFRSGRK